MPRPVRSDEAATETITVRVTPAERRELKQVARQNQTNLSGVIREAVNEYVSDCRDGDPPLRITKP